MQLHHVLPALVWLSVVLVIIGLFSRRAGRFEMVGIAQSEVRHVAATCTGRLRSVPVKLYEPVSQGQVVAVIDTVLENEPIKAQLATIGAEIEHLMAQLIPTQEQILSEAANMETIQIFDRHRIAVDVENTRLRILELRAMIASDKITLEDLAMEVKITEELFQQDVVASYELQKAQVQRDSLAKKIEENEHLLEQARADLEQAQQRSEGFTSRQVEHLSVDSALEVIRKEVTVQERLMEELLARSWPVELRSPIDGVVIPVPVRANEAVLRRSGEKIICKAGDVVQTGDPILAIAQVDPNEIIAYVDNARIGQVQEKTPVELIKNRAPAQIARSEIVYVGPTMELMPERLRRNPNIPQWGKPIIIAIPPGLKLTPGELVGIRQL